MFLNASSPDEFGERHRNSPSLVIPNVHIKAERGMLAQNATALQQIGLSLKRLKEFKVPSFQGELLQ